MIRICSLFIIFTAAVISPIVTNNFYAYAVQAIWRDYEDMKELVKDIRNGNKNDDNMDWDKFRDSTVYKNENEDVRDCIDLANKVGGKLGDYEIVRCFDNANYYKEKYTDEKGIKNEQDVSKQQEVNQSQSEKNVSKQQEANQSQSEKEGDVSQTQNSSDVNSPEGCDSSYPDICISITSAKLSCFDIPYKYFKVLLPDRHEFDSDGDGIGCEG
ncbi:MAG: hypothetical protein E6K97_08645 [Thaumarchaeota archaeon]|nr:MAG: hypothetical protein E6K97_08645 [Nitrososphaerota archaeon]